MSCETTMEKKEFPITNQLHLHQPNGKQYSIAKVLSALGKEPSTMITSKRRQLLSDNHLFTLLFTFILISYQVYNHHQKVIITLVQTKVRI